MRLILASTSPRRREILGLLGVPFEVEPPRYEEIPDPGEFPDAQAARFALGKARSVRSPDAVVLGSDTVVAVGDVTLGKPIDQDDARRMLKLLRGRTHRVVTSVALLAPGRDDVVWSEAVRVHMRDVSDEQIETYLRTGESLDKAGAYALQGDGDRFIAWIDGDRFAVIGLPLRGVADALHRCGIHLTVDIDALYARPIDSLAR